MGGKQLGFSDYELTAAKKQTKREKILSEMEAQGSKITVPSRTTVGLLLSKDARETLENQVSLRENGPVIAGQDWIDGAAGSSASLTTSRQLPRSKPSARSSWRRWRWSCHGSCSSG